MATNTATIPQEKVEEEWIHLLDTKSFSRVLYTNPVCFLCTVYNCCQNESSQDSSVLPRRNVMVVSWLTATNNTGRFLMSINKRRYTAKILTTFAKGCNGSGNGSSASASDDDLALYGADFVLCVPVKGMEDLVLNVGKASGRWKSSKFPLDHRETIRPPSGGDDDDDDNPRDKKKKIFQRGIDGLLAVRLGCSGEAPPDKDDHLFAIQGTVAHLHCRIYRIVDGMDGNAIDDDHHLILAEVVDAFVRKDYWNAEKRLFQPIRRKVANDDGRSPPPYMKFFGSQTFGYVIP